MSPKSPRADAATRRIRNALASVLRELRSESGLSQERLAAEAGYDRTYIGQIERSEKSITIVALFQLAAALKASPADILQQAQSRLDAHLPAKHRQSGVKR